MEGPKRSVMSEKDCFIFKVGPLSGEHPIPPGKLLLGDRPMTQTLATGVTVQVGAPNS